MLRWQAIVFDLDDTLYPERHYVLSGMRAIAVWGEQQFGLSCEQTFAELRRLFEQGVRGNTFDLWLESHDLEPADWVRTMVQVYRQHDPQIAPNEEVPRLLDRLCSDHRLGLVTDGCLEVQQRKMAALGLEPYFQAIIYSDVLGRDAWKPSPRPFQAVMEQLSVAADRSVYVGDNPVKDFRGARQVGMDTIRLRQPNGLYYQLEPLAHDDGPHMEIATLAELETLLEVPRDCPEAQARTRSLPKVGS